MYIPNDYTQNWPFYRLQLVVEMFRHSTWWTNQSKFKSPKLLSQWNRKCYHKTLGTCVIKSPMSPPSLDASRFQTNFFKTIYFTTYPPSPWTLCAIYLHDWNICRSLSWHAHLSAWLTNSYTELFTNIHPQFFLATFSPKFFEILEVIRCLFVCKI